MNKVNLIFLIALVPIVVFLVWVVQNDDILPYTPENSGGERTIYIDNVQISVEIADTSEARQRGLSGRDPLPDNHGLLFVFDEPTAAGIWMKDMRFPIDIIWIARVGDASSSGGGETLQVTDIKRDVSPDSFPETFYPRARALYVVEVNAGFTEVHNIGVGDPVRFSF